ncbi:hypothetical protein [Geodermatophilus chilensis]|jgi:hypothetical protein|uniref:hypothetical protein n=1 Tax=Geodermatophilus chilensis TaxID=2035835 RepID=UPI0018E42A43|nr:hypothetical protein [Geodermatophilus chilensis]
MTQDNDDKDGSSSAGSLLGLGAVGAAILCCAGPALVSAGLLGGLGGVLRNPVLLLAAGALLVGALVLTRARRSRPTGSATCCPPDVPQPAEARRARPAPHLQDSTDSRAGGRN